MQLVALAAATVALAAPAAAAATPDTALYDGSNLLRVRATLQQDHSLQPAAHTLMNDAAAAADPTSSPWSVMTKPLTAASGDKHDYMSIGELINPLGAITYSYVCQK